MDKKDFFEDTANWTMKSFENGENIYIRCFDEEYEFDESIYSVLCDFNYVALKEKVDNIKENQIVENVDEIIGKIDDFFCDLLFVKKVLLCEISSALDVISRNHDDKHENAYLYDYEIRSRLSRIDQAIEIMQKEKELFLSDSFLVNVLRFINYSYNSDVLWHYKKVYGALEQIEFKHVVNILEKIRSEGKSVIAEKLYILSIISMIVSDSTEVNQKLYQSLCVINNDKEFWKISKSCFVDAERRLDELQSLVTADYSTSKHLFSFISSYSSNNFDNVDFIKRLIDELSKVDVLKKYVKDDKEQCYACMIVEGKKYVSVSGTTKEAPSIRELRKILSKEYEVIPLNDEVRYYFNSNQYITYRDYKVHAISNNNGRMFSCCERKLLTKLYGMSKGKIEILLYVKKRPCYMCEDAINQDEILQHAMKVIYKEIAREKYDVIARDIFSKKEE